MRGYTALLVVRKERYLPCWLLHRDQLELAFGSQRERVEAAVEKERREKREENKIAVMEDHVISAVHTSVFKESENLEGKCTQIQGYDFNQGLDYSRLIDSLFSTGFQASIIGDAVEVVNQMVGFS